MNALTRKFRVASTTGVVMSLAMASVLAMAPMSNAMAKSQKGKIVTVMGSSAAGFYPAWATWSVKANSACGNGFKILKSDQYKEKNGQYVLKTINQCM